MARRNALVPLFLVLASVCVPRLVHPQALTGTLIGTVKDQHGGVLAGALVKVHSPALIGGPAAAPTNDRGQLRFQALPPGTYVLEIEMAGFVPFREEGITVGAEVTIERTVVLGLTGVFRHRRCRGSGWAYRGTRERVRDSLRSGLPSRHPGP